MEFVPDRFKNDKKLVLIAIKNNPMAYKFINDRLKYDKDIYQIAWETGRDKIKPYIPSKLYSKLL